MSAPRPCSSPLLPSQVTQAASAAAADTGVLRLPLKAPPPRSYWSWESELHTSSQVGVCPQRGAGIPEPTWPPGLAFLSISWSQCLLPRLSGPQPKGAGRTSVTLHTSPHTSCGLKS